MTALCMLAYIPHPNYYVLQGDHACDAAQPTEPQRASIVYQHLMCNSNKRNASFRLSVNMSRTVSETFRGREFGFGLLDAHGID